MLLHHMNKSRIFFKLLSEQTLLDNLDSVCVIGDIVTSNVEVTGELQLVRVNRLVILFLFYIWPKYC